LTGFLPLPAGAQNYPARFVVPSTAGSGFDTVVRTVGQNLPR
jgi:tripartite-type tricarboxylate transporter receptor subunit TctC